MKHLKLTAIAVAVMQLSRPAAVIAETKSEADNKGLRGAVYENAQTREPAAEIYQEYHLPENSEYLIPADETFIFWGLPEQSEQLDVIDILPSKEQAPVDSVVELNNLAFSSGDSDLTLRYHDEIRQLVGTIGDKRIKLIRVIGHTDSQRLKPSTKAKYNDNMGLSVARAQQVVDVLKTKLNLKEQQITAVGMGETKPIADNNTLNGMTKNRRVEVEIWFDDSPKPYMPPGPNAFVRTQVCNIQPMCRYYFNNEATAVDGSFYDKPIRVATPVRFAFGRHNIVKTARNELAEKFAELRLGDNDLILIEGHTDDINIDPNGRNAKLRTNQTLSKRRAKNVADYLIKELGVNASQIKIEAKGAAYPLADNLTEEGRQLNRRVEVLVQRGQPAEVAVNNEQFIVDFCGLEPQKLNEVSQKIERIKLDKMIEPVKFVSGSHQITAEYVEYLTGVVNRLSQENTIHLKFVGHTDSDPLIHTKDKYGNNQGLSEFRAREIMQFIMPALGLDENQGSYEGFGASKPVAPNDFEFNKAKNRRVEIELWVDRKVDQIVQRAGRVERIADSKAPAVDAFGLSPFRITVDGRPIEETEATHIADRQRCTDVALEKTELQIQPENLELKPALAVAVWPPVIAIHDDQETFDTENITQFQAYSNYLAYIERAEVRLFKPTDNAKSTPLAVVPLDDKLKGEWQYNDTLFSKTKTSLLDDDTDLIERPDELIYIVRVYNKDGLYDETVPRSLWLKNSLQIPLAEQNKDRALLAAYGENMLNKQRIKLDGGTVKVNGINVPDAHNVYVMGRLIPVDTTGKFVTEQIIPEGYHNIEVAVLDENGNGELFHRELELAENDWFFVGIADVTMGVRDTNGPASLVTQNDSYDDDAFATGRLAFFTEGKTKSNIEITASADTREQPLEDLFSNFTSKDPTVLFRRLDEDLYYPTFGDDSTIEEAAPTQGKFYIKAEKDGDHVLWGNFDASVDESELVRVDRGLYGAQLKYGSDARVESGDEKIQVEVFAAEPGTIGAREEFRGTGGSVYFLKHQDLTIGSENVYIETRDEQTGQVLSRERIAAARDYDIDYIQGRILLESPVSSFSQDGSVISSNSLSGNPNFLVVTYEYAPGFEELDDLAIGGRASAWLSDSIELGVTAIDQEQLGSDQTVTGVDVRFEADGGNYIKVEAAQSKGLAVNQLESLDGGFAFTEEQQGTDPNIEANALRVEAAVTYENGIGLQSYIQTRESGFSASGQVVDTDTTEVGVDLSLPLTQKTDIEVSLEKREEDIGQTEDQLDIELAYKLNERWRGDLALRRDEIQNNDPRLQSVEDTGVRDELGAAIAFSSDEDWSLYGFGQYTISSDSSRDKNNRLGVGGAYNVNDKLRTNAELSEGTSGLGASIGLDYQASENSAYYFTLANENQRSSTGLRSLRGNAVAGFKNKYSERIGFYGEERYAYGDQPQGLTHAYGVDFAANEYWNYGAGLELGTLRNTDGSDTDRLALSTTIGYTTERSNYIGVLEFRSDETISSDRQTWLTRQSFDYQTNKDWRLIAKLDWSMSDSSQGEFFDGDFTEAVTGFAYRPVDNDQLNALVKYTYFFNKPAPEQVNTTNNNSQFIQRSQIISLDVTYDIDPRWSIGGKYAYKMGELALDRINPNYFSSDSQLLVLRADWHLVNSWDFLIEARALEAIQAQDIRSGFLVGLYKHINKNWKVGVGYNFTDFSDDLTDLSFDDQGVFINIIGKM